MTAALPSPEPYEWRGERDQLADAGAIVACALLDDNAAASHVLGSLDRQSLVSLIWVLAAWYSEAVKRELRDDGEDAIEALREAALRRDRDDEEGLL